jgi:hypothetical protein
LFLSARVPERNCVNRLTQYPAFRSPLYNSHIKETIARGSRSNPAPENLCSTTALIRPIRTIVDPDDLIPCRIVRIRTILLVSDSPLHSAKRTTQQQVQTSLTPALSFATCSLFAPLFFLLSFPSDTTSKSRHPSTPRLFQLQPQPTNTHNMPPKGSVSHLLHSLQPTLCLPLHLPPEHEARVDACSRIGHKRSLYIDTSLTLLSAFRRCLANTLDSVSSCSGHLQNLFGHV